MWYLHNVDSITRKWVFVLPQSHCWKYRLRGLIMQRADLALCSLLCISLSLALVTHDIRQSNLIQTCSCVHTVMSTWGILWASCAYKIGSLPFPTYVSYSSVHLWLAAFLVTEATPWSQEYKSVANNSHTHIWGLTGLWHNVHPHQ